MVVDCLGVVLAGGKSQRFGSPKAFAKRNHIPFYQYSLAAIKPYVSTLIIVTNPMLKPLYIAKNEHIQVTTDIEAYKGKGPLAGILTAMETVAAHWYLIVPIDVPFVKHWVFKLLIEHLDDQVDAVIPVVAGKRQPLLAIYHYSMKDHIKKQLHMGQRSMYQLLKNKQIVEVEVNEEQPFININRQTDYQLFIQGSADKGREEI